MPATLLLALGLGIVILAIQFYRFMIADPLCSIPGPFITRLSSVWLAWQCRLGRRSKKVHQLHLQYGSVVRITSNHVSINDAKAIQDIYHRDKDFHKGPWYDEFNTPTPPMLTIFDHAQHAEQRKNLLPAFSLRSLKEFELEMNKNYLRWKDRLLGLFNEKGEVELDLNEWVNYLAFDLIGSFSFGKPFGFVEKGSDFLDFIAKMEQRLTSATALGVLPLWIRPYMRWIPFDGFWRASAESVIGIRRSVRESYNERMTSYKQGKDLLSYMVSAKSESGNSLSEAQMLSHMTAFVIAGSDSTAASIIHFVDFVSRDEGLQRKVQEEIDAVFPGMPDADWVPLYSTCQTLRYITAVAYEVLRLRPTAAVGLERFALQKTLTFSNYSIPPGTLVSVPTYSLHRDPAIFPEPDFFKPERWLAEDTTQQHKAFNLFSQGPRNCIGQNFAWMEMMKSIVLLFKLFNIERADTETETELFEGFFLKAGECRVKMTIRG